MSCGTEDCGCGCQDLVQLKIPPKEADLSKEKEVSKEARAKKPTAFPEAPS